MTSPEYGAWAAMRYRCLNPKSSQYHHYGGRGIKICERWNDFRNFLADVGRRPSPHHSLDRYPNNNGNYEPGNVRWATKQEQSRNTRSNRLLSYNNLTLTVAEWAERIGVRRITLFKRLDYGWSIERALTEPAQKRTPYIRNGVRCG